ncbi:MAG: hypothetical protein WCD53_01180 [Microcoleus sp.]
MAWIGVIWTQAPNISRFWCFLQAGFAGWGWRWIYLGQYTGWAIARVGFSYCTIVCPSVMQRKKQQATSNKQQAIMKSPRPNSQFPIPNSQFPIPNSQFPIPNSLRPTPYALFPIPY